MIRRDLWPLLRSFKCPRKRKLSYIIARGVLPIEWRSKCLIFYGWSAAQFLPFSWAPLGGYSPRVTTMMMIHLLLFDRFYYLVVCICLSLLTSANKQEILAPWLASFSIEILARLHHMLMLSSSLLQGILVQEIDEGRPCLSCGENCSGFRPHQWR